jgi:hypothetical protein
VGLRCLLGDGIDDSLEDLPFSARHARAQVDALVSNLIGRGTESPM